MEMVRIQFGCRYSLFTYENMWSFISSTGLAILNFIFLKYVCKGLIGIQETTSGIYCIENTFNHKKYIGQSKDIDTRWKKHIYELTHNKHHNDYLQKSWNKYGKENFRFYNLERCCFEMLDEKERYWIDYYDTLDRNCGYNLKDGGQNGGSTLTIETREKLSKSIRKSYENFDLRNLRRKNALAQWSNPKIKEKISKENNGMYGKKHSEESKKRMSEHSKGRKSPTRNTTPVFCVETKTAYEDATDAHNKLGYDSSAILKVCQGKRKTCGGYHWAFINN